MKNKMRNMITAIVCLSLILSGTCVSQAVEKSAEFKVDGEITEWTNVTMQDSDDSRIQKWAVVQDSERVYFYVQQNGGNAWGLPITETKFKISYADDNRVNSSMIQFAGMMDAVKDAFYGDVKGAQAAYKRSDETKRYEIEFSVPKSFFADKKFTLTYCGSTVESGDIQKTKDIEAPVLKEAVYEGINIDGDFRDWAAISKVKTEKGSLLETAMIFDGDYVYIYLREDSEGALTHSGAYANGSFTIYSDLGRDMVFKLNTDSIEGIKGAEVYHSNLQYEISIPKSEIKQYKDTISFGYYMDDELLIENVANLKEDKDRDTSVNDIGYDGSYDDWEFYPHHLIQYSTPGDPISDAEGALYQKDAILYGHVKTYMDLNTASFKDITLRFNEDEEKEINFTLVTADKEGNINRSPQLHKLAPGTYEYYLWERSSGSTAKNINDETAPIYGKLTLTISPSSDEAEYYVDLKKVAKELGIDVTDMKLIQAQYINIGLEWVTIGGTSSGPVLGIILSIMVALTAGFMLNRKKKLKVKVAEE